jgi:putative glutamine amidotransferase
VGAIVGAAELQVNSFHHQAINRLGRGLRDVAWAPDGVIEAVDGPDARGFVVGVQWHPEDLVEHDPAARNLFSALVAAARR